jgi:hypothetical protein
MIENPIYGGAYAYGKTSAAAAYDSIGASVKIRRKARSEWLALMPNAHEGYVSWDKAETIRKMVTSNVPTSRHHDSGGSGASPPAAHRHAWARHDLIAGILNRNGMVTGYGNRWMRERVTSLRSHHRIPVYKPADNGIEPWLNLSKPHAFSMSRPRRSDWRRTRDASPQSLGLLPGPWIFNRAALATSPARAIAERARKNPKYPTGSHPDEQSLFSSNT